MFLVTSYAAMTPSTICVFSVSRGTTFRAEAGSREAGYKETLLPTLYSTLSTEIFGVRLGIQGADATSRSCGRQQLSKLNRSLSTPSTDYGGEFS